MFVDRAGAILDDNDMYPWGGVVPGVGQTTSNNAVKFTGQYRDGESQLDYFGPRYYSNLIGRWMSPDWSAKPTTVPYAKFGDPQSLNLYSYTENGPVTRIDNGHGYAGFDGFMRPSGGAGVDSFNESHNGHGEGTLVVSKEQRTGYNMVGDTIEVITPVQLMPAIQNNTAKPSGTADACYAQLRYRYVKGGTHAWWALGIGLIDFTISGTGDWSFSYPVLHDLNAYVTEGTTSRSNPGDNLKNGIIAFDTKSLHGGFASPDDCSVVKAILKRGQDYEQHHNGQFSYDPSGLEPRTSNTIAYYVGWPLHSYTSPPPGSVGWGIMLEGLTYGK
jgi:RHS repeat-associated protein